MGSARCSEPKAKTVPEEKAREDPVVKMEVKVKTSGRRRSCLRNGGQPPVITAAVSTSAGLICRSLQASVTVYALRVDLLS